MIGPFAAGRHVIQKPNAGTQKCNGTKQKGNFGWLCVFCLSFIVLPQRVVLRSSEVFFIHVTGELQKAHSIFGGMRVRQESRVEKCRGSVLALDLPVSSPSSAIQGPCMLSKMS